MEMIDIGILMSVIGLLVLATNVITEVLKHTFKKLPAQILAFVVSMVLTLAVFFGYCTAAEITILWYMVIGAVAVGFFVSYGAQFGFDKLKEIVNEYKGDYNGKNKGY